MLPGTAGFTKSFTIEKSWGTPPSRNRPRLPSVKTNRFFALPLLDINFTENCHRVQELARTGHILFFFFSSLLFFSLERQKGPERVEQLGFLWLPPPPRPAAAALRRRRRRRPPPQSLPVTTPTSAFHHLDAAQPPEVPHPGPAGLNPE